MSFNNCGDSRRTRHPIFEPGPGYAALQARIDMRPPKLGGYSKKDQLGSIAESWGSVQGRNYGMFGNQPDPKSRSNSPFRVLVDPDAELTMAKERALRQARQGTEYEKFGGGRAPQCLTAGFSGTSTPRWTLQDDGPPHGELSRPFSSQARSPPFSGYIVNSYLSPDSKHGRLGDQDSKHPQARFEDPDHFKACPMSDWKSDRHNATLIGIDHGTLPQATSTTTMQAGHQEASAHAKARAAEPNPTDLHGLFDSLPLRHGNEDWSKVHNHILIPTSSISTWTDDIQLIKERFDKMKSGDTAADSRRMSSLPLGSVALGK